MAAYPRAGDGSRKSPSRTPAERMAALLAAAHAEAPTAAGRPDLPTASPSAGSPDPRDTDTGDARRGNREPGDGERLGGWTPEALDDGSEEPASRWEPIAARFPRILGGGDRWSVRLGAVLLTMAVLLAVGCVFAVRAAARPPVVSPVHELEASSSATSTETGGATTPAGAETGIPRPTPAPSAQLKVHVVGQVRRPGVVALPAGARVEDAVRAAGGATRKAELDQINLARLAVDGEQIYVPAHGGKPPPAPAQPSAAVRSQGPSGAAGSEPVDLNAATEADLDGLPGIGPVTAQKILQWREDNGGFTSVEDLLDVPGIGPKTFADLKDLVRV